MKAARYEHAGRSILFVRSYYGTRESAVTRAIEQTSRILEAEGYVVSILAIPSDKVLAVRQEPLIAGRLLARIPVGNKLLNVLFPVAACITIIWRRRAVGCVITVDHPPGIGLMGRFLAFITGNRVLHLNWVLDLFAAQGGARRWRTAIKRYIERSALRGSRSSCITIGTCMRQKLRSLGINSVYIPLAQKVGTVPSCDQVPAISAASRVKLFYGGHLGPRSPIGPLIDAIDSDRFCLRVSGFGPDVEEVRARARSQEVAFLGNLSDEDYRFEAHSADIHVVSLAEELVGTSVPSKTYSAFAMGKPVLYLGSSRGQAAADTLDAEAGWVAPLDSESIRSVLSEMCATDLGRLGSNGRDFLRASRSDAKIGAMWVECLRDHGFDNN